MRTLTVDDSKRIRIPTAKPRQVFALTENADGSVLLVPVKAAQHEEFPPGSLVKYITPEWNAEQEGIARHCVQSPARAQRSSHSTFGVTFSRTRGASTRRF